MSFQIYVIYLLGLFSKGLFAAKADYNPEFTKMTITFNDPKKDTFYLSLYSPLCRFDMSYTKSSSNASVIKSGSGCNYRNINSSTIAYRSSETTKTLEFDSAALRANTVYTITVTTGKSKDVKLIDTGSSFTSADVQSTIPRNVKATSTASSFMAGNRISVSFRAPTSISYSVVLHYELVLRIHLMSDYDCTGLWRISCSDCASASPTNPPQLPNRGFRLCRRPHFRAVNVGSFKKSQTTFSLNLNSSKVLPNSYFLLEIQAVNWWGLGPRGGDYVRTPELEIIFPGAPNILVISSVFPDSKLLLQWSALSVTNIAVSEYIVVLNSGSSGACIAVWRVTCSDCLAKPVFGVSGIAPADAECSKISATSSSYASGETPFILTESDVIQPSTEYTVVLQARNFWGYGNVTTEAFTSGSKKFPVVLVSILVTVFLLLALLLLILIILKRKGRLCCKKNPRTPQVSEKEPATPNSKLMKNEQNERICGRLMSYTQV